MIHVEQVGIPTRTGRIGAWIGLWLSASACDTPKAPDAPLAEPAAPTSLISSATRAAPSTSSPNQPTADPHPPEAEAAKWEGRVVLVTLDGVRWEDVFTSSSEAKTSRGDGAPPPSAMPNLMAIVRERGIALGGPDCEHDMRASGPNFVSLPGYIEMFSGKPTSCTHNGCAPVQSRTVLDDARATIESPGEVAVFSSWSRYQNAVARDRKALTLSAGAHTTLGQTSAAAKSDDRLRFLLEVGAANQGYPGHGDYRPDEHTAKIALRYLETVGPRLLVLGLGDADEQAHRGDVAGYRRAIKRSDEVIAELDRVLARMGNEGSQTAVLVTTDHGRAKTIRGHGAIWPESQRVFFAAFGARIAHRGITCATSPLHLADVAGSVRSLLGVEGERGPLASEVAPPETTGPVIQARVEPSLLDPSESSSN